MSSIGTALRKSGMDQKLHLFFPQNARTMLDIINYFNEQTGFDELCKWYTGLQTVGAAARFLAKLAA